MAFQDRKFALVLDGRDFVPLYFPFEFQCFFVVVGHVVAAPYACVFDLLCLVGDVFGGIDD